MFSRTPAEPDMDTLTYWAQRLEPLIRAESEEEIIVVFCNRCGKEEKKVYAGTSAVIGIKDGEVSVYGLLGRGVKDLLVVDTDVAPFAKLVYRPETTVSENTIHVPGGRPTMNDSNSSCAFRQVDSTAVDHSANGVRKPTPTPGTETQSKRPNAPSPIVIPSLNQQHLPLATPIEESPVVATPTAPSPTPFSTRPQIENYLQSEKNGRTAGTHSQADATLEDLDFHNDSIWVNQSDSETHPSPPSSNQISEKYFWLPPQPTFKSPRDANFPELPPVSPVIASSLLKLPGNKQSSMKHLPAPELALSPELDGGYSAPNLGSFSGFRKESYEGNGLSEQATDNSAPPRPASPKSRNASRTGRPLDRRPSIVEQPKLSGMIERLDSLTRPNSASEARDDDVLDHRQGRPRTPKSRPTSRAGRPPATPQPHESALGKTSRSRISTNASLSIFSEATMQAHSDAQSTGARSYDRKAREPGTIRPCPRAGGRSRNRSIINADDHARSRSGSATTRLDKKSPHIEPDETRTMVWSELSKLVGEVLQRPKSRDVSRGRQPAADQSMSADVSSAVRATRSETRGVQSVPRIDRRVTSQERHAIMGSQSGRSAASHQLAIGQTDGPTSPYNPEDEIVAEIIFHHHRCPTHSHRHQPTPSSAGTPRQTGNLMSPPSMSRNTSRPGQDQESQATQRPSPSLAPRKSPCPLKPNLEKRRSQLNGCGPVNISTAPTSLASSTRQDSSEFFPTLDGTSIHTITKENDSPATPPLRVFEPTTPKAMRLTHPDFGSALTSGSDPTENGDFTPLKSLDVDLFGIAPDRPRSAVW